MICPYCQTEAEFGAVYCPKCGAMLPQPAPNTYGPSAADPSAYSQPITTHPVYNFFLPMLGDTLFLVMAILCTAGTALSLFAGGGFNVFGILFAVFLWLVYTKAKNGEVDRNNLRHISGTAYALYVVSMVAAIACLVGGALTLACGLLAGEAYAELLPELEALGMPAEFMSFITQIGLPTLVMIVGAVFLLCGVVILLFTLYGYRRIHRFIKSLYKSLDYLQFGFEDPRPITQWLIAFGVIDGISALRTLSDGGLISGVAAGCLAACYILAAVLVKKYFLTPQPQEPTYPQQ